LKDGLVQINNVKERERERERERIEENNFTEKVNRL
jgi:hypothetical protein